MTRKRWDAWKNLPKGPRLTPQELEKVRGRIASGQKIDPDTARRLVQTIEAYENEVETGFTLSGVGFLSKLPRIGSGVYAYYSVSDICYGIVIGHVGKNKIKVAYGEKGEFDYSEEVLSKWSETPLPQMWM